MITKVHFTGNGGYINKVKEDLVPKKGVSWEEFKSIGSMHHYRGREFDAISRVKKSYPNKHLKKTLLNREFTFEPNKINLLFGPNGSGKTTIIRAIAAHGLCGAREHFDGFTNFDCFSPMDVMPGFDLITDQNKMVTNVEAAITRRAGNEAVVEWDGFPVYYQNIASRNSNTLGSLVGGGIINSFGEEMLYRMNNSQQSAGQQSVVLFNLLVSALTNTDVMDIEKTIETTEKKFNRVNDTWVNVYRAIIAYYKQYYRPDTENKKMTVLLDEIDKSLDINTVISLYNNVMPNLASNYPVQIIAVSHSPIILTDNIFNNPMYNIISLDENYTTQCRKSLSNFTFGK